MIVSRKIMNTKKIISYFIVAILFISAGAFLAFAVRSSAGATATSQTAAVQSVDSTITADGKITAQDQASLHFQTAGKLTALPFKEGDSVYQGQMIAQLDTYALQRMLTQTLNTYRSTRDTFDQAQQNSQDNALQNQQRTVLASPTNQDNAINDAVKRIVDQNQANLDNSVVNVEIANYAVQLATLTSPLTGIITHEDVTVAGQNITPVTTFTVADPNTKVFQANIPASDIDYVSEGMNASVILDGVHNKITGTVVKIYPSKVTLASGEDVYKVDIQSDALKNVSKLDQAGTAIIMTNAQDVMLIPAWTVLSGKYVWVSTNGKPALKAITVGSIHGNNIEVTSGLSREDKVITDPKSIPAQKYRIL